MNKETENRCIFCNGEDIVKRDIYIYIKNTQEFHLTPHNIHLCKKCDKDTVPCFIVNHREE
jgi:hypothetical protein